MEFDPSQQYDEDKSSISPSPSSQQNFLTRTPPNHSSPTQIVKQCNTMSKPRLKQVQILSALLLVIAAHSQLVQSFQYALRQQRLTFTQRSNIATKLHSRATLVIDDQPTTATKTPAKRGRGRPRGRPDSVPGAVSKTTMRNRTALIIEVQEKEAARQRQLANGDGSVATTVKRGPGRPRKTSLAIPINKQNKKNIHEGSPGRTFRKLKGDRLNLQKYYDTELLSAEEEYSLGMKVRFMMKCEEVHEGLELVLGRPPSIEEWASACGFKDYDAKLCDPNYRETHYEAAIRPTSNSNTIENRVTDTSTLSPNFFVGNTLANNTGVGRGRGRVRKTPPTVLSKFYDDSAQKFSKTTPKSPRKLVNTGTPSDFVALMHDGKSAKSKMVECNMRLVVSIARRYYNVGVNIQDLVQEGSLGLMRAAEKFIPSKGFKFSTYASWWIQQAVFRSIAYNSRTIRLPVHVHNWLNRVRRIRTTLQEDLGRAPTNDEIAKELDMTPEKFSKMLLLTRRTISLEMPKYQNNPKDMGHESEASLGDSVDSSAAIRDDTTPEQRVDQGLFQDDLKDMLNILGDDEKKVICLRYGLDDGLTRTVTTVALQLRQTKAW
eukprot:CAMPEP_0172479970 /NCGR_PEP_ID=MMETSP1066-20121228/4817_1 /TAXON_ID=671091 /ORGANISM="Coscinodiscus wailesii, Strain CCMP2513" /LENGTH=602 /DNA_ID=CAMNT_0013240859 /DNA_START=254 /DNA_END=2059 /DNA_ORIENTATION=+